MYTQNDYKEQRHVHELTGSTRIFNECDDCHNHRFCTVSCEAIYSKDKRDHFHEVKFHTDFSDEHFHEFDSSMPTENHNYYSIKCAFCN